MPSELSSSVTGGPTFARNEAHWRQFDDSEEKDRPESHHSLSKRFSDSEQPVQNVENAELHRVRDVESNDVE